MKMADAKENGAHPDFLNSLFGLGSKRKKKRNLEWESDLPESEIGDYLFIPLTTSRQLRGRGGPSPLKQGHSHTRSDYH